MSTSGLKDEIGPQARTMCRQQDEIKRKNSQLHTPMDFVDATGCSSMKCLGASD